MSIIPGGPLRVPLAPRPRRSWVRALSFVALVLTWQIASFAFGSHALPSPAEVAQALLREALTGGLAYHLGMTLYRVAVSFFLAMAVGTAIGIFMGRHLIADRLLDAWLIIGLNLPALVVIVLCYIWFGLNDVAAIMAVAISKIPVVATIMREEARSIDMSLVDIGRAFQLPRLRILRQIYLPQLHPGLFASARSGLALIWKLVLVVELLGRPDGVGFKIRVLFNYFDIAGILAYAIAFIAIVLTIEWGLLIPLEQRATAWRRR